MIEDELLKQKYIFEIRFLDHIPEKPNVYTVKIKKFSEQQKKIVIISSGYSPESVEKAYGYAVGLLEQNQNVYNEGRAK